MEKAD